ncbi:MAG: OmpH family outer membrane protein [Bryobacteraceae bacterium]
MKINTFAWFCIACGTCVVTQAQTAASSVSVSATQAPTKVGVIQVQAAIVSTKDGQKAVADLDTKLAPLKNELEKKQAEIRELQDKLQRGGNAMAEAAKADLSRTIDQKTKSYQRDMEDAQSEYQDEQRKMLEELGQKMEAVIDKYAVANGYSVILDVSNPNTPVLYAANAIDITKEIIDLYDKTAPGPATSSASKPTPPTVMSPRPAPAKPPTPAAAPAAAQRP